MPETTIDIFQQTGDVSHLRRDISEIIIKTLVLQLSKEENAQVKEVIVAAVGGIGLPEARPCID